MGLKDDVADEDGVEVVLARAVDGRFRSLEAGREKSRQFGPNVSPVHPHGFRLGHQRRTGLGDLFPGSQISFQNMGCVQGDHEFGCI